MPSDAGRGRARPTNGGDDVSCKRSNVTTIGGVYEANELHSQSMATKKGAWELGRGMTRGTDLPSVSSFRGTLPDPEWMS